MYFLRTKLTMEVVVSKRKKKLKEKNKFLELRTVTFATDSVMVDPIRAGPFIFDAPGDQSQ